MPNVFDADVIIRRIRDLFGVPYEAAKNFFHKGNVVFSVPVTDANVAVNVAGALSFSKGGSSQTLIGTANAKAGTSVTAGTGATLYTVTSGKKLYVTHINISATTATALEIRDGTISGTLKIGGVTASSPGPASDFVFPTPIEFSTAVFVDLGSTQTINWSISGWEE